MKVRKVFFILTKFYFFFCFICHVLVILCVFDQNCNHRYKSSFYALNIMLYHLSRANKLSNSALPAIFAIVVIYVVEPYSLKEIVKL